MLDQVDAIPCDVAQPQTVERRPGNQRGADGKAAGHERVVHASHQRPDAKTTDGLVDAGKTAAQIQLVPVERAGESPAWPHDAADGQADTDRGFDIGIRRLHARHRYADREFSRTLLRTRRDRAAE